MNTMKQAQQVTAGDKVLDIPGLAGHRNLTVDEARTYNKFMTRIWFTDGTSTGPMNRSRTVVVG